MKTGRTTKTKDNKVATLRIWSIERTSRDVARASGRIDGHRFNAWLARHPDGEYVREMAPGSHITSLILTHEEDHTIVADFGCTGRSIKPRWCKRPTSGKARRLVEALAATLAHRVFKDRK